MELKVYIYATKSSIIVNLEFHNYKVLRADSKSMNLFF